MLTYNQYSLKSFHTLAINNISARKIIVARNITQLLKIWNFCKKNKHPFLILGEGSNTVFLENYQGVIVLNRIKGIYISQNKNYWFLHVQSGEKWHKLVQYTLKTGLFGLENLAFIPGYLGSAIIQNIGAFGVEIKDVCQYVDVLFFKHLKITRIYLESCSFQYRSSIFKKRLKKDFAIISIGLQLKKKWNPIISYGPLKKIHPDNTSPRKIFNIIYQLRKKKIPDPKILGNAGSFFINPIISTHIFNNLKKNYLHIPHIYHNQNTVKISASWLIKKSGLSKYSIGGASVYNKNPLILVNQNNATAKDIIYLAKKICLTIKLKFNILIKPEVQIIAKQGHKNFFRIIGIDNN